MRKTLLFFVTMVLVLPVLVSAEDTWKTYAEASIPKNDAEVLREIFLTGDAKTPHIESDEQKTVDWTWWSWSEQTGSDWPDDDALYRRNHYNMTDNESFEQGVLREQERRDNELLELEGVVKIVAADSSYRFVVFELDFTPKVNLSNQTLLYVVLTEDVAEDQHHRQTQHLVRELRPEVAFSLQANNTTHMTALLPAEHLFAAGVDLSQQPLGWSYSIAVFGAPTDATTTDLLILRHDRLPTPHEQLTSAKIWTAAIISALALVLLISVVMASHRREHALPVVQGAWANGHDDLVNLHIQAGTCSLQILEWEVLDPWQFKRRPALKSLAAREKIELQIAFKSTHHTDCHIEMSIDIEQMGGWRQHVWLSPP